MTKMTVNQKVAALPNSIKKQLIQLAYDGESITSMADRFKLDYGVVQTHLWQSGTLPWRGAKVIIARRLRSLRSATKRDERDRLVNEIAEQVDYLYYAARQLGDQLARVKKLLPSP